MGKYKNKHRVKHGRETFQLAWRHRRQQKIQLEIETANAQTSQPLLHLNSEINSTDDEIRFTPMQIETDDENGNSSGFSNSAKNGLAGRFTPDPQECDANANKDDIMSTCEKPNGTVNLADLTMQMETGDAYSRSTPDTPHCDENSLVSACEVLGRKRVKVAHPTQIEMGVAKENRDDISSSAKNELVGRSTPNPPECDEDGNSDTTYEFEISTSTHDIYIKNKPTGRRIVNIAHIFDSMKTIAHHGPPCDSSGIGCIELVGERQRGLFSQFKFVCKMCNRYFFVDSDSNSEGTVDINCCAVAGTVATGIGHSQLQELTSALDLPMISPKLYSCHHDLISKKWEEVAHESMSQAAEKERAMAITEGRVDKNGIPIIDVIADGCWSQRSYKKKYSALSGAAAIIGKKTGEILYMAVKNKYCCVCAQAENKKVAPNEHVCFKNYSGPSTGMESIILVEGFKRSIEQHNLIYGRLISDGDSSTYAKILESRPYENVSVEKIECRNHILRNLCNKLQALQTDTQYSIRFRKLITKTRILSLRSVICKAIKNYSNRKEYDVQLLYNDILLAHLHAFGNHAGCKAYFCSHLCTIEDITNDFYLSSLWQKICLLMSNVAAHARSLIHDVDSNVVERYHSIVAKFVGGKRINFSSKNSYQTRCTASVVSFNTKKTLSKLYKSISGKSPQGKLKLSEERKLKRLNLMKRYKKKKRRIIFTNQGDHNYGDRCERPDMSPEMFEKVKKTFLDNLKNTDEERQKIQESTILQSQSSEWLELRRSLLTASNFSRIIKKRPETSCVNIVKDLLYKAKIDHVSSIKHGRDKEKIALDQLAAQEKIKIRPCGLFIDAELPFLGATPDGLCGDDTIIEIKCPITAHKLGIDEAIKQKKVTFWVQNKNKDFKVNTQHPWYFQIQGQLHITKRSRCLFAVWYSDKQPLKTEIILRDDKFWTENMEQKLSSFYLDCLLPELVDPRNTRNQPIRDPIYIENALQRKKNQKASEKRNKLPLSENIDETQGREDRKDEEENVAPQSKVFCQLDPVMLQRDNCEFQEQNKIPLSENLHPHLFIQLTDRDKTQGRNEAKAEKENVAPQSKVVCQQDPRMLQIENSEFEELFDLPSCSREIDFGDY